MSCGGLIKCNLLTATVSGNRKQVMSRLKNQSSLFVPNDTGIPCEAPAANGRS